MSESKPEIDSPPAAVSAGALLRQARERAGLHIGALSVSLKVPVQRLEALEADRHDLLPGPVFSRALALSVCRSLKLDPGPVLGLLPHAGKPDLKLEGSLNEPFRLSSRTGPATAWLPVSAPALWIAGALILGAMAVFFWPDTGLRWTTSEAKPAAGSVVTESVQAPYLASAGAGIPPAPAMQAQAPAAAPGGAVSVESPTPAPGVGAPLLLLRAQKPSWVEVVDASDQVLVRRTLAEGEQVPVTAASTLRVTIGNVGSVSVLVRGSPLDLAASTQGNVARFEVK